MEIDDSKIREALQRDEQAGFRLLVMQFQQPLYWHIRRMVVSHDDANDVLQETFIRVYRSMKSFRWESSLKVWLFRIATNESLRLIKSRKITAMDILDSNNSGQAAAYVNYDSEMEINFQRAVQSLPEKQRVVFNLRYYDEMEYSDIEKVADIDAGSAKVDYFHAKRKIKEFMTKNMI